MTVDKCELGVIIEEM